MRLKSGFVLEEVAGTYLAVAVGERAEELQVLVKLNDTGAFLWKQLSERDVSELDLVDALHAEYDVSESVAERSVSAFLHTLYKEGLIDG